MKNPERCFIVSVGTSLIGNYKKSTSASVISKKGKLTVQNKLNEEIEPCKIIFKSNLQGYKTDYKNIYSWLSKLPITTDHKKIKDASAELNSLFSIEPQLCSSDKIIFFPTLTVHSSLCAQTLSTYIKKRFVSIDVKVVFTEGLGLASDRGFAGKGLPNFIANISKVIEGNKDKEITLVPTGGYKSIIPYITLAGLLYGQERNVKINYIYETSDKLLDLPSLPVGVDISTIKPYYPKIRNITSLPKNSVKMDFDSLPNPIKNLFDTSNSKKYKLNDLGNFIINRYMGIIHKTPLQLLASRISIVEHLKRKGSKSPNLGLFFNELVNIGSYFWVGDKVPGMVDHALHHHNNLFEISELVLSPILSKDKKFLKPEELFTLLCTIYFHDWGHTLSHFPSRSDRILFPTEIRDYHHILGYERLKEEKTIQRLWTNGLKWGKSPNNLRNDYLEAIATIGLYHRKAMPLESTDTAFRCPIINRDYEPLSKRTIKLEGNEIKRKLFIAALFRVIDSLDTQYTRVSSVQELVFKISIMKSDIEGENKRKERLSKLLSKCVRKEVDNKIIKPIEKGRRIDVDEILKSFCLNESENTVVSFYIDAALNVYMNERQIKHYLKHLFIDVPRITHSKSGSIHQVILEYQKFRGFFKFTERLLDNFPEMKQTIDSFASKNKLEEIVKEIRSDYDKVQEILKNNGIEFIFKTREGNKTKVIK